MPNGRPIGKATELALLAYLAQNRAQFAVKSLGGLRPLLQRDLSRFSTGDPMERPPAAKAIRYRTRVAFRLSALWSYWGGSEQPMERVLARALTRVQASGAQPFDEPLPLRSFEAEEVGGQAFAAAMKTPVPFVVRGWGADTDAVQGWSFEGFLERYGDEPVLLSCERRGDFVGPLSTIREPGVYLHNSESLLRSHPELATQLDLERFADQGPGDGRHAFTQLFIGRGGTGTPYHCANQVNLFLMISGRKRWTFVDPRFTLFMFPAVKSNPAYMGSYVGWASKPDPKVPLYPYAPRYTVDLEPGDVVFNPPWWWHSVENLSDTSIGVATRWGSDFAHTNSLFHLFQKSSLGVARLQFRMMRDSLEAGYAVTPWEGDRTATEASSHDPEDRSPMNPRVRTWLP